MRDEILTQLKAALALGAVLFGLCGVMVAHGYDDVGGDVATAPSKRPRGRGRLP
jgi:microcystin degradation protein MlrC